MTNWKNLILDHIKENNIEQEDARNLKQTAEAADLMKEKFLEFKLKDIDAWCKMTAHNKKLLMYNEDKDYLYPGFTQADWIKFLSIPIVNEERILQQQLINQINKGAAITGAIQSGSLKDLKLVKDINKNNKNTEQPTFVYMNAESLFAETKSRVFEKCPKCNHRFLASPPLKFGEEEYE